MLLLACQNRPGFPHGPVAQQHVHVAHAIMPLSTYTAEQEPHQQLDGMPAQARLPVRRMASSLGFWSGMLRSPRSIASISVPAQHRKAGMWLATI
jgi:hypothetical protein